MIRNSDEGISCCLLLRMDIPDIGDEEEDLCADDNESESGQAKRKRKKKNKDKSPPPKKKARKKKDASDSAPSDVEKPVAKAKAKGKAKAKSETKAEAKAKAQWVSVNLAPKRTPDSLLKAKIVFWMHQSVSQSGSQTVNQSNSHCQSLSVAVSCQDSQSVSQLVYLWSLVSSFNHLDHSHCQLSLSLVICHCQLQSVSLL